MLTETFPILRPIKHYVISVHRSSCKVSIILFECKLNLIFLDGLLKYCLIRNFMKRRPVGTELFYVDGQTDRQTVRQTDRMTDRRTDKRKDKQGLRS